MKALVTGASGGLGHYVCRAAAALGWSTLTPSSTEFNVTNHKGIDDYVREHSPDVILHLAALANVDLCQREPQAATNLNTLATLALAKTGVKLVFMSTNDVFSELIDVDIDGPYEPQTVPAPGNIYAWSKYAGEQSVLASGGVVVRANFFTRRCRAKESFVSYVLRNAQEKRPFDCYTNVMSSPVFAETLAKLFCELAPGPSGIFHVGTVDSINRHEQAQEICHAYGLDSSFVRPKLLENRNGRPLDARLMPNTGLEPLFVNEEIKKLVEAEPL